MNILLIVLTLLSAYLLGSVPTAVWVGKKFHGIDVREHGSGNAGATNVIRVLGWKTGVPVLLIDVLKGWLAAMLPVFFNLAGQGTALLNQSSDTCGSGSSDWTYIPCLCRFQGR